jgi:hypothetical protein
VSVLDTAPSNGGLTRACFPFVRLLRGIVMALGIRAGWSQHRVFSTNNLAQSVHGNEDSGFGG